MTSINITRNKNTNEGEELFKLKGSFVMKASGYKLGINLGQKLESLRKFLELDLIS